MARHRFHYRRRGKRNPMGVDSVLLATAGWAVAGAAVAATGAGAIMPQATGFTKIGVQAAVAVAASMAGRKFISPRAGDGVLIGGAVLIFSQIWNQFIATKLGIRSPLGLYTNTYFGPPYTSRGLLQTTDSPVARAAAGAAAAGAAAPGMGALVRPQPRFRGKWSN